MAGERTYTTREVAEMWNVSESTIKRWADTDNLNCFRTPGGHRRFRLEDILAFQKLRGFEATGLLSSELSEDPDLELWLNKKSFSKVQDLIFYLLKQNQRFKVVQLLDRLYLRGMSLEEIYDEVLVPLVHFVREQEVSGLLTLGQAHLIDQLIEEAVYSLFVQVVGKDRNGLTAMCGAPADQCRFFVNGVSRTAEIAGWDSLNLGQKVSFEEMATMVQNEPVDLICVISTPTPGSGNGEEAFNGHEALTKLTEAYDIPIIFSGDLSSRKYLKKIFPAASFCVKFGQLRRFLNRIGHGA